jgi:hypothetical protein
MMRVLFGSTILALLCSGCAVAPPPPPYPVAPPGSLAAASTPGQDPGQDTTGQVTAEPLAPPVSNFQTQVNGTDPNCHDYTGQAMIEGKEQQVVGHACKQSDGSWKIAEGTATQPNEYTAVYPAPVYYYSGGYNPYYYDYDYGWPFLWDTSFGFGSSFVFFDHHFHGFRRGGFHRGGFRGGFHGGGFHGGGFHGGGGFHH